LGTNLGLGASTLGFWGENEVLPESCLSKLAMVSKLVAMVSEAVVQLAMPSDLVAMASCTMQQLFVVLGLWGGSGPFQTDSFDVIKCN